MCELLGIEQSVLERAFSYRTVEAKMEKVSTTLNVSQVRLKGANFDQSISDVFQLYSHRNARASSKSVIRNLFHIKDHGVRGVLGTPWNTLKESFISY